MNFVQFPKKLESALLQKIAWRIRNEEIKVCTLITTEIKYGTGHTEMGKTQVDERNRNTNWRACVLVDELDNTG